MHKLLYSSCAVVALFLWITLFSAGLLVDSAQYRQTLFVDGELSVANLFLAMLLYTPTNVALLSMLSGFIGGCASGLSSADALRERLMQLRAEGHEEAIRRLERRLSYLTESPLLSMLRGFLTYLGIISGILLVLSDPFANPSAEQYIRTAGLISAVAFVMGYDPTRFEELLEKFYNLGQKPPRPEP